MSKVFGFWMLFSLSMLCGAWGDSSYSSWFSSFEEGLDVGALVSEEEMKRVEDFLAVRPRGVKGDFLIWMKGFGETLQGFGKVRNPKDEFVLKAFLKAKPENQGEDYEAFLLLCFEFLNDFGAILDSAERMILGGLGKGKPASPFDSEVMDRALLLWNDKFQVLVEAFGQLDQNEEVMLTWWRSLRPKGEALVVKDDSSEGKGVRGQLFRDLFGFSPSVLSEELLSEKYGKDFVNWVEIFYRDIVKLYKESKDPELKRLIERLDGLSA